MAHIGDLSDIIDDPEDSEPSYPDLASNTSDANVPANTVESPLIDIAEIGDIDPMSFINTCPQNEDSDAQLSSGAYALD